MLKAIINKKKIDFTWLEKIHMSGGQNIGNVYA